jgi:hypothetical protein
MAAYAAPGQVKPDNIIKSRFGLTPVVVRKEEWRGSLRLPLWRNNVFELARFRIAIPSAGGRCLLFWEAQAPLMRRKAGLIIIETGFIRVNPYEEDWSFEKEMIWKV